jgi:NAD(P)-dependent dehydrogenase (short-subunit alcohol dehydrogenase family)
MRNKIALITGPTSGIGRITAIELAKRGFDLILVARNPDKVRLLQQELNNAVKSDFVECDLSSIASVQAAVKTIWQSHTHIDVLINNAGLIMDKKQFSKDGIELTFATNHIGPFVLTTGLIDLLKASDRPRIINVSSLAHRFTVFDITKFVNPKNFIDLFVYGRSKLANILFSNELAERLQHFGITSNALHPGIIASSFAKDRYGITALLLKLIRPLSKSPLQGAQTTIYLATSPNVERVTGRYFKNYRPVKPSADARNRTYAKELWALSEQLVEMSQRR